MRSCKAGLPASIETGEPVSLAPLSFPLCFYVFLVLSENGYMFFSFVYFLSLLLPKTFFLEDDTLILADHNRDSSAFYLRSGGVHAKFLQSCPALCDPVDCSPPGIRSSVHEILHETGGLEWVSMASSKLSSHPRDRTCVSMSPALAGGFFTTHAWAQRAGCVRTVSVSLQALPAAGGEALERIEALRLVQTCPPTGLVCLPHSSSL